MISPNISTTKNHSKVFATPIVTPLVSPLAVKALKDTEKVNQLDLRY